MTKANAPVVLVPDSAALQAAAVKAFEIGVPFTADELDKFYLRTGAMTQSEFNDPVLREKTRGKINQKLRTKSASRSDPDSHWLQYDVSTKTYSFVHPPQGKTLATEELERIVKDAAFIAKRARKNGSGRDDEVRALSSGSQLMNILRNNPEVLEALVEAFDGSNAKMQELREENAALRKQIAKIAEFTRTALPSPEKKEET